MLFVGMIFSLLGGAPRVMVFGFTNRLRGLLIHHSVSDLPSHRICDRFDWLPLVKHKAAGYLFKGLSEGMVQDE